MSHYAIRKSRPEDLKGTMELFTAVTDQMLGLGIDQWNHDYPTQETIRLDILSRTHYVISEAGVILATVVLDNKQDDQYKSVHWRSRNKNVMVIHRLAILPQAQGLGLAKKLCAFAESHARSEGYESIRLDAYAGNKISNNLYLSLGYHKANGLCYFRQKAIPFYCFEKSLVAQ